MSRMRYGKIVATCAALALVGLFLTLVQTHSGRAKPRPAPRPQQETEAQLEGIKPGNYATAINIHNPSPVYTVNLYAKAVVDSEPPSSFHPGTLAADYAKEINCYYIENTLLDISPPDFTTFKKGFVVIFANAPVALSAAPELLPLDVVGVYTAEPPSVTIPIPYSSGPSTQTEYPGIAQKMLTIVPRLENVPAAQGALPAGQYFEYAVKFLCGEVPIPVSG